jgi:hypothetical protein
LHLSIQRPHALLIEADQANQLRTTTRGTNLTVEAKAGCTGESDDGLSAIEVQAMGRLVPLYNDHNYDRVETSENDKAPSETAEATTVTGEGASWRAVMKRMLSRETLPRSPKKATSRKPGPRGTRLSEGVEPQITRLKRRPSLFLRIFNRTLEQNQSYLGHKPLVQDRPSSLNSSKMATPKIGDGQLSLAGEFPTSNCSQTLTNEIHL